MSYGTDWISGRPRNQPLERCDSLGLITGRWAWERWISHTGIIGCREERWNVYPSINERQMMSFNIATKLQLKIH